MELQNQIDCMTEFKCEGLKIYEYKDTAYYYYTWDENCVSFISYILSSISDDINIK